MFIEAKKRNGRIAEAGKDVVPELKSFGKMRQYRKAERKFCGITYMEVLTRIVFINE